MALRAPTIGSNNSKIACALSKQQKIPNWKVTTVGIGEYVTFANFIRLKELLLYLFKIYNPYHDCVQLLMYCIKKLIEEIGG